MLSERIYYDLDTPTELLSAVRIRNVDAGIWHARREQKVAGPVG